MERVYVEGWSGETSASCFAWLSVEGREGWWGGREEGEVGVKGARGVGKEIAWRLK
jgi:hypothetical protein